MHADSDSGDYLNATGFVIHTRSLNFYNTTPLNLEPIEVGWKTGGQNKTNVTESYPLNGTNVQQNIPEKIF